AASVKFLEAGPEDRPTSPLNADAVLVKLSEDNAPYMRELCTSALGYWNGKDVDTTLLRLTKDDGHGEDPIRFPPQEEAHRKAHPDEARRHNQKNISQNAALRLALRGSPLAEQASE